MSSRRSLLTKLGDNQYLDKLSHRRLSELMVCKIVMSEDELESFNSIDTAYNKIARERFIRKKYGDDYWEKVDGGVVPFFLRYSDEELVSQEDQ